MTVVVWWITCLIWSTVWLAIKVGVSSVPPLGFAGLRLAIAGAIVLPIAWRRARALGAADLRLMTETGLLLLGANYAFTYWGSQFITSGMTATLQATTPLFGIAIARAWLPGERAATLDALALAVGLIGVGVMFWPDLRLAGNAAIAGAGSVIAGAFCVALAYARVRRHGRRLDTTVLMGGQMAIAAPFLLALSLAVEGNPLEFSWTRPTVATLAYLVVAGSLVAFWLNYWLLARMPVHNVLLMAIVEPVIAVALGAAILDERVTFLTVVGATLILAASSLVLFRREGVNESAGSL